MCHLFQHIWGVWRAFNLGDQSLDTLGTICNSCKESQENRPHFFTCKIHAEIINKLYTCFVNLKLLKTTHNIAPYFYNHTISINHPTNLILIWTYKYMYNLRFDEIVPNIPLIKSHVSKFVSTAIEMYPYDNVWKTCERIPLMLQIL